MRRVIVALVLLLVAGSLAAESDWQIGAYGTNRWAVGELSDYALCITGGGFVAEYQLPFLPLLGVSARTEGEYLVPKDDLIENWWNLAFSAGVSVNLPLGKSFAFKPELSYGVLLNIVNAPKKEIEGVFADQLLQLALSFRIAPESMGNFSIEIAPLYTILTEQTAVAQYLGLRVGIYYAL